MIHSLWTLADEPDSDVRLPIANDALRSILLRRGVTDADSYRRFVAPSKDDLYDAALIHGVRLQYSETPG